ncbi:MAG: RNA methyltransferase [Bacteroidetes bacterium]|nr:RNA methyltransferase [Bacteroidota bacterium]
MLSKNKISFITSLHQKKFRKLEQLFIAEGEKVVSELLSSGYDVKTIVATASFLEKHHRAIMNSGAEQVEVSEKELGKVSVLTTPNEVLAVAAIPSLIPGEIDYHDTLTLALDDVSDPGNLGTIIRIADWFGILNIVCSNETVECFNAKVVQASMGSLFRVNMLYADLDSFLSGIPANQDVNVYGTALDGKNIYEDELSSHGIIVLGSESKGIRDELKKYFTESLLIPSFHPGKNKTADSLNVAATAAIVCSEFRRRK